MADANEELRRGMETTPVEEFDIEHVDDSVENVIEMVSVLLARVMPSFKHCTPVYSVQKRKAPFLFLVPFLNNFMNLSRLIQ